MILTLVLLLQGLSVQAKFDCQIIWKAEFSEQEKEKLTDWVYQVGGAVETTLGKYPFSVNIYFHRKDNAQEPVPWANTARDREQAVHFHVNPKFSLEEFLEDWTAPHELAHLSIPYVGEQYRWFSEGYASFMQWQIMHTLGVLSAEELKEKYQQKIAQTVPKYHSEQSFLQLVQRMRLSHDYPGLYYGGACFFMQINTYLQAKGSSLMAVIRDYQQMFRMQDKRVDIIVRSLDEVCEDTIFRKTFHEFETRSGKETVGKTEV